MTGWTGWDEHAVRRPPPEQRVKKAACLDARPLAYGFTPINASGAGAILDPQPGPQSPQTTNHGALENNRRGSNNKAISEYLGRTNVDARVTDGSTLAGSLQASTTKELVRKTRKRAATTAAVSKQKRQKSANLIDVMPASKLHARNDHAEPESLMSAREPSQAPVSDRKDDRNDTMTRKSSVRPMYSTATSVEAIQSTGLQTSMSALHQSRERGFVAYQRQKTVHPSNNAEFTRPWLNQTGSLPCGDAGEAPTVAKVHRPSPTRAQMSLTIIEEYDNAPSASTNAHAVEIIRDSTTPSPTAPSQNMETPADVSTASKMLSEEDDCFLSDYDDDDAIILLEAAENEALHPSSDVDQVPSDLMKPSLPLTARSCSVVGRFELPSPGHLQDLRGPDEDFVNLSKSGGEHPTEVSSNIGTPIGSSIGSAPDAAYPARDRNFNQREVEKDDHYRGAFLSEEDVRLLAELKSAKSESRKRVLRTMFPPPILDRTPIFGASSTDVLRSCFRIGEALNAGSQAFRANKAVTIELYARVMSSHREDKPNGKQHFIFHDLYHDKPPHLQGSFELWSQSRLWDLDSKAFLAHRKGGIMCRVIAKMRRQDQQWRLQIHSIWECDWEDVDYVAGIYTA